MIDEVAAPQLNCESIEHRLITIRKSLERLEAAGPVGSERLADDPAAGLVIERILALLADVAGVINSHVSTVVLGEVPQTPAASFGKVAAAGLIEPELANLLAPPAGLHHVQLQLCLDINPDRVRAIVTSALAGYNEYVRQVSRWTSERTCREL